MNNETAVWEAVIGLEVHVELNTKSKLFSSAPNRFGDAPNSNITEVCTGQPGALPVLNKEAVRKAVQFGCAINAKVANFSKFDRKSYFYPDSPRNFQITQFDEPIVIGGEIIAEVEGKTKKFAVNRAHLEDDAGMLKHFSNYAGVDYNRAGVPLLEVVSEPCLHTSKDAVAYGMAVKAIMEYIDASDCNMEEGSLRMDANISVRRKGEKGLRNKVEIKNMNSFSNMEKAIEVEIKRQVREYNQNPHKDPSEVIQQATFRWDADKQDVFIMRRKESSDDYRYFPEPDLLPIVLTDEYIETIRKALPELPYEKEKRYIKELGLSNEGAFVLTSKKALADFFEEGLKTCKNAKSLCNWLIVEFAGRLKDCEKNVWDCGISSNNIGRLVNMIDKGSITGKIAKKVAEEMILDPIKDCEAIVAANPDFQPLNDSSAIDSLIDQVIAENPDSVSDYKAGTSKAFGHLVGQVMKLSHGKASPKIVNELLKKKIDN
jgi:aspartyl-tRNA(Asn)/glutamyl-tRNA(Gln) amidotransferase subunit B